MRRFASISALPSLATAAPTDLHAKISFMSREAEFTPPVIYSREQRQKLVFRVEARPDGAAAELTVGQPVDGHARPRRATVRR